MTDNVLVLEPGDERAQKIAKAMGSPVAGDILKMLAEKPSSLTDITERLAIPMNTAKYHVENLLDAGVIAIENTRYSIKGREVKIYSLTDQLLIVAPRRSDIRSLLLKYASLFGIVALSSLAISSLLPLASTWGANEASFALRAPAPAVENTAGAGHEVGTVALKASYDTMSSVPASAPDPAVAFFLGGVLVIVVLLCYEAWLWKKRK